VDAADFPQCGNVSAGALRLTLKAAKKAVVFSVGQERVVVGPADEGLVGQQRLGLLVPADGVGKAAAAHRPVAQGDHCLPRRRLAGGRLAKEPIRRVRVGLDAGKQVRGLRVAAGIGQELLVTGTQVHVRTSSFDEKLILKVPLPVRLQKLGRFVRPQLAGQPAQPQVVAGLESQEAFKKAVLVTGGDVLHEQYEPRFEGHLAE
jgi:hypothetical protein